MPEIFNAFEWTQTVNVAMDLVPSANGRAALVSVLEQSGSCPARRELENHQLERGSHR